MNNNKEKILENLELFVVPGERLGSIEEGISEFGTYEDEGNVRAAYIGRATIDKEQKKFSVLPITKMPIYPYKGQSVIAKITSVQNTLAVAQIIAIEGEFINKSFTGLLHSSRIRGRYEKNLRRIIKPGDLVRCKVISSEGTIHLGISGNFFGVIEANCSICGRILKKIGRRNQLRCDNCGNVEIRLLASDYGVVKVSKK
ncbi:MAG: exosome complex RNA-binding protein Csl4 [Thermoproteota archaeon]|nr:exosome complex RNA-binding protein Csl4 [Candidatus Brockarchaeota archaeon]MBO3762992.1 exosome complex RNA-binding protein Csl4 [Candidatus Brockarchaeota archaeon]MBO3768186.1 exosome complex RNA-binding protein Csl4 [Candidatus Brockarchaeota archaeon]MBO3800813.1 exosome complex RNA-binding protein Csl4 [Candidatus Brockarchaeota archaeon]